MRRPRRSSSSRSATSLAVSVRLQMSKASVELVMESSWCAWWWCSACRGCRTGRRRRTARSLRRRYRRRRCPPRRPCARTTTPRSGAGRQPAAPEFTHSQLSPKTPRNRRPRGVLRPQLGDFTLDPGVAETRAARGHQLALDLVDDLDGAVDAGVGHIDGGGAETKGVLHRGEALPGRSAWRRRSTSRPHRRTHRRRAVPWRGGSCASVERIVVRVQRQQRCHGGDVGIDTADTWVTPHLSSKQQTATAASASSKVPTFPGRAAALVRCW